MHSSAVFLVLVFRHIDGSCISCQSLCIFNHLETLPKSARFTVQYCVSFEQNHGMNFARSFPAHLPDPPVFPANCTRVAHNFMLPKGPVGQIYQKSRLPAVILTSEGGQLHGSGHIFAVRTGQNCPCMAVNASKIHFVQDLYQIMHVSETADQAASLA